MRTRTRTKRMRRMRMRVQILRRARTPSALWRVWDSKIGAHSVRAGVRLRLRTVFRVSFLNLALFSISTLRPIPTSNFRGFFSYVRTLRCCTPRVIVFACLSVSCVTTKQRVDVVVWCCTRYWWWSCLSLDDGCDLLVILACPICSIHLVYIHWISTFSSQFWFGSIHWEPLNCIHTHTCPRRDKRALPWSFETWYDFIPVHSLCLGLPLDQIRFLLELITLWAKVFHLSQQKTSFITGTSFQPKWALLLLEEWSSSVFKKVRNWSACCPSFVCHNSAHGSWSTNARCWSQLEPKHLCRTTLWWWLCSHKSKLYCPTLNPYIKILCIEIPLHSYRFVRTLPMCID